MNYKDLVEKLKDGSVTLQNEEHITYRKLIDVLEQKIKFWEDMIKKHSENPKPNNSGYTLLEFYNTLLLEDIVFGSYLDISEVCCHNCDSDLYVILLDEKTLVYTCSTDYWKLADASANKYQFIFKKEDIKVCAGHDLIKSKKLVSTINVPTGNLIFQNFFNTKELYEDVENEYKRSSINSILGRNYLMQYLSTKNVGYGQMGNMGVAIYSNENDEIIVADSYIEDFILDYEYYDENDKDNEDNEDYFDVSTYKKKKEFLKYCEDNNFKRFGDISLDVWRWMCADKSVLEFHNELPNKNCISLNVQSGNWQIEHYYDFDHKDEDIVYSRLKLIK